MHTRFEHSLGTLAAAQDIIDNVNRNPLMQDEPLVVIGEPIIRLIRLAALLHDIPHVPFGHTLEDEFCVLDKHDSDQRYREYLGPGSELCNVLGKETSQTLITILAAKSDDDIEKLDFPYIADIVGNTICADLLDYIRRDMYLTGLEKTYDTRFLNYFYVPQQGPCANRLVLNLWKKDELRRDVLSEVLDLLRLRYGLAEKVLYHRAKASSGAMISRAFQESGLTHQDLNEVGDEVALDRMEHSDSELCRYLIDKYRRRSFYKRVYLVNYPNAQASNVQAQLVEQFYNHPEMRREYEDQVAGAVGLPPGRVLIYCPHSSMLMKEAEVKVRWTAQDVCNLKDVDVPSIRQSVQGILEDHKALWKFWVFLDPAYSEYAQGVADACYEILLKRQAQNDIPDLRQRGRDIFRERIHSFAASRGLLSSDEDLLLDVAARGGNQATDEQLLRLWQDISSPTEDI